MCFMYIMCEWYVGLCECTEFTLFLTIKLKSIEFKMWLQFLFKHIYHYFLKVSDK